jgi:non-ribosomal peptide synthetase component F/thioesterase domain-containing protein
MRDLPVSQRDDLRLRRYLEMSGQPAGSAFHTSQVSISFGEAIDGTALRAAWELVAQAHSALHAAFGPEENLVEASPTFAWTDLDWQSAPPDDLGVEWQSLVQADTATPIASGDQPPARITLIRLPNGDGHALWSFHAALLDDTSISHVLHRWLHAYDCLRTSADAPQFDDDIPPAESAEAEAGEEFASRPLLILPLPEADVAPGTRRSISHTLERPERAELAAAAGTLGGNLSSLFGAAWAFVIARATSAEDALLAEPVRPADGIGRLETFAHRLHAIEPQRTAADLVRAFAGESPGEHWKSEAGNAPVFLYRDHTLNDRLLLAMPRWMAADTQLFQKSPAAITLRVVATDRPELALDYDPAVLSDAAARMLFEAFRGTVTAFAADPALVLAEFPLPGNPALVETPEVPTAFRSLVAQGVHEMFADAATETPDAVAAEIGDEKLTFSQLNATANQLARLLRKRGVQPGARVGIAAARSPQWIAALLGTLKAGATIVPLRPDATGAKVDAWIVDALPEGETREQPVIALAADAGTISNEKSRGLQNEAKPDTVAIAWESGPDDRSLTHEGFATALASLAGLLALEPADRVLQFAPTGTFAAVEETLVTLLSGATLVLRAEERWPTRTAFQEFIEEKGVTALSVPSPFWNQWVHYLSELSLRAPASLRLAVSTGELPAPNATAAWPAVAGETRRLHRTEPGLANGLSLGAEFLADDPFTAISLGRPAPGTLARIVDAHGLPLPLGLAGFAEIASAHAPEKFAPLGIEAFVAPDGIFHARTPLTLRVAALDTVSPAEAIRHVARTHPQVLDAYAAQHLIAARNEWCLWIVPRDSERGEPHDFRDWLTEHLPAAPRRIRAFPRFPLDAAGHIDLAALAEQLPEDAAAPTSRKGTDREERVRQAISRALGGRRIELDEILTEGRTKPAIAKLLLEAVSRDEPRVELADFTTGFSVRSLLRNIRGRGAATAPGGAETKSTWIPLQPLRASGKLPPLILIHDFDGTAKPYAALVAHLGDDQPCYAITARGLADPDASHATVEEMARAYVEALRVFDAAGPYRLLGYGFGGLVAFEMARQLAAAKTPVPLLVALATEPPAGSPAAAFLSGGWKRALPALFGRKSGEEANARRRRTQDTPIFRANQEAARKFTPTAAAPLALHVFAPEHDFPAFRAVQASWLAACPDAHFYQVPCSGPEMMDEPAVESIADAIKKLARAEDLSADLDEEPGEE